MPSALSRSSSRWPTPTWPPAASTPETNTINVLVAGQRLTRQQLQTLHDRLASYSLTDAHLIVRQGLGRLDSADAHSLRTSLLEDVRDLGQQTLSSYDDRLTQRIQRIMAANIIPTGLPTRFGAAS